MMVVAIAMAMIATAIAVEDAPEGAFASVAVVFVNPVVACMHALLRMLVYMFG
jgi:hypothetical protein